ncbi:hypothetical protein VUR80DRAFT_5292 [Thermomyces stellatus]
MNPSPEIRPVTKLATAAWRLNPSIASAIEFCSRVVTARIHQTYTALLLAACLFCPCNPGAWSPSAGSSPTHGNVRDGELRLRRGNGCGECLYPAGAARRAYFSGFGANPGFFALRHGSIKRVIEVPYREERTAGMAQCSLFAHCYPKPGVDTAASNHGRAPESWKNPTAMVHRWRQRSPKDGYPQAAQRATDMD